MNHSKHFLYMGLGLLVILVLSKVTGYGLWFLFPILCIAMMVAMMFGMDHTNHK